jgi:hypothetical protein
VLGCVSEQLLNDAVDGPRHGGIDPIGALLSVLTESRVTPDLPLSKLAEVIDESFGAGQPLNSSMLIPSRGFPRTRRVVVCPGACLAALVSSS